MHYISILGIVALTVFQVGCSSTRGAFVPNTHFAYPNSNVQPLDHISTTVSEGKFLFAPTLDKEKILKLMNDALTQHAELSLWCLTSAK